MGSANRLVESEDLALMPAADPARASSPAHAISHEIYKLIASILYESEQGL